MLKKTTFLAVTTILFSSRVLAQTPTDLELLLSIDVSGSVSSQEFTLQRQGYIDAFNDSDIINAIVNSPNGIAVGLTYWASRDDFLEIPWTLLQTADDVASFATSIANTTRPSNEGGGTAIFRTINSSVNGFSGDSMGNNSGPSFFSNNFNGSRLVLDVSGDGTSSPSSTQTARDNAISQGVIINGLAIENSATSTFITDFYTNNVIGGTDSFVETAAGFDDFASAVKTKLEAEIPPTPNPNPNQVPEPTSLLALLGIGTLVSIPKLKKKLTKINYLQA